LYPSRMTTEKSAELSNAPMMRAIRSLEDDALVETGKYNGMRAQMINNNLITIIILFEKIISTVTSQNLVQTHEQHTYNRVIFILSKQSVNLAKRL
jgi:hypothetical protein